MSGYTPLFDSLTTGTLYGRWPDIGVWPIVLSLADHAGIVDVTPQFLAGVTGLPVAEVIACMQRFCEPDPYSRTRVENGARLKLIDEHRTWGWRVVNHGKYREKARLMGKDAARTESGADAERKRLAREAQRSAPEVPRCPPVSPEVPLSYSYSDSDSNSEGEARSLDLPSNSENAPDVPRGTAEASFLERERIHAERMLELKAIYPKAAREGWITAERTIRRIIEGGVTWDTLIAGVKRYRKHCDAENRPASDPARWFGDENMPWNGEWPISKKTPRGAIAPAGPSNEAAWAEAKARAKAIGFRPPAAGETPAGYTTQIKLAENARPVPAVAQRLGLAGIKRIGA
jgi:hypothetical protein